MLKGSPASAGVGIGKALVIRQDEIIVVRRNIEDPQAEKERFHRAVEQFCDEVRSASEAVKDNVGAEEAGILTAQMTIATDPELEREVCTMIDREKVSAEYAFRVVCDKYIDLFSSLEDELMRARVSDFKDIKTRLLCILLGIVKVDLGHIPAGSILVGDDITPSQAALLDPQKVCGIATQFGTRYSHIAIIARALQIPAVVGVEYLCASVQQGDELIIDGESGDVIKDPDAAQLARYRERQHREQDQHRQLLSLRNKPTVTADGRRIELAANLAMLGELSGIADNNADGIGLFRTEFLYMDADAPPSEEKQFEAYKRVLQAMNGKPVIIRTLDIGGDKEIPYLGIGKEENPFLGYRAVRYCLAHTDLFKAQLSALIRASAFGNLKIMIPMISSVTELRDVKQLIKEVKRELTAQSIRFRQDLPVGVMIETPAAAICADTLAAEADFFSIGTNDLAQYTIAVDRCNENVAKLYSPLHPAVLRLIQRTVEAAKAAGIMVGVCGEAASDPLMVPLLIGAGVDELSVAPGSILAVRRQISEISHSDWQQRVSSALRLSTPGEVAGYVKMEIGN